MFSINLVSCFEVDYKGIQFKEPTICLDIFAQKDTSPHIDYIL